jgi:hypothetical protein
VLIELKTLADQLEPQLVVGALGVIFIQELGKYRLSFGLDSPIKAFTYLVEAPIYIVVGYWTKGKILWSVVVNWRGADERSYMWVRA